MKKAFYLVLSITFFIFIFIFNLFFKINSDINHIIGINIIIFINFMISLICFLTIKNIFKKEKLNNNEEYKKFLKIVISNSFVTSSIISIFIAIILYGFLKNILSIFNLKTGLINYIVFASKIWFISAPFIGLEITIIQYFNELKYYKTPIIFILFKLTVFLLLGGLFYIKYKTNCFVYAKPICDLIFLPYYSKICFRLTLNNNYKLVDK